jgi:hypothetical protein
MADADTKRQAVIGPAEFAALVKIYNTVLAEPWFTTDREQRDRFRKYIIKACRSGLTDTDRLAEHCREVARHHFSTQESS